MDRRLGLLTEHTDPLLPEAIELQRAVGAVAGLDLEVDEE